MKIFSYLQAILLCPYLLLGLGLGTLGFGEPGRNHDADVAAFTQMGLILFALWLLLAVPTVWLSQRRPPVDLRGDADWRVIFPASARLFTLGAPVTFFLGFGVGAWLG